MVGPVPLNITNIALHRWPALALRRHICGGESRGVGVAIPFIPFNRRSHNTGIIFSCHEPTVVGRIARNGA